MSSIRSWPPSDADHLLVSAGQMAALEQDLFDSGLPVPALMEKAALAVAARLRQRLRSAEDVAAAPSGLGWPANRGVLVLVGPGHNGGDGLVVRLEGLDDGLYRCGDLLAHGQLLQYASLATEQW